MVRYLRLENFISGFRRPDGGNRPDERGASREMHVMSPHAPLSVTYGPSIAHSLVHGYYRLCHQESVNDAADGYVQMAVAVEELLGPGTLALLVACLDHPASIILPLAWRDVPFGSLALVRLLIRSFCRTSARGTTRQFPRAIRHFAVPFRSTCATE